MKLLECRRIDIYHVCIFVNVLLSFLARLQRVQDALVQENILGLKWDQSHSHVKDCCWIDTRLMQAAIMQAEVVCSSSKQRHTLRFGKLYVCFTSVCTMCGRFSLILCTKPLMSTALVFCSCWSCTSRAIIVPVLPTPALRDNTAKSEPLLTRRKNLTSL